MNADEEKCLDELLDCEGGLSAWEMDFVEDLDKRRERSLTPKQAEKLMDIWDKVKG